MATVTVPMSMSVAVSMSVSIAVAARSVADDFIDAGITGTSVIVSVASSVTGPVS